MNESSPNEYRASADPAPLDGPVTRRGVHFMASVRVFLSSPYRDMQAERAYLHEVVFPRVAEQYQASGYTLEIVDPRLTATSEEEAEGVETLEAALDEVVACRPHFLCLLGNNYGKVTLEVPDAIGRKHPAVRHFFRTSRVHLETLAAVIREPEQAAHAHFYFRKPQIVTKLFDADKSAYVPNNKMEALNEVEAHKLEIFKEAITRTGRPIFHYSCQWDSMSRQLTGFEQLGARVENDLLCIVGLASAAVVEETVPGSMATEEMMPAGSMLAGAAVGAGVVGAAALGASKLRKSGFSGGDDNAFENMATDEIESVAPVHDDMSAAAAFSDDAAMDQIVADAAEVPDDGGPAALAGEGFFGTDEETVVSDPNEMDADAAAAILGGNSAAYHSEEVAAEDDSAAAILNDAAVPDTDAEAAALDIFGEDAPAEAPANADENPFEVDTPAEEEVVEDIVGVEDEEAAIEVADDDEAVEVAAEEEEEEAPKKKKGGWFGKKK
jgi:hypothetical protein